MVVRMRNDDNSKNKDTSTVHGRNINTTENDQIITIEYNTHRKWRILEGERKHNEGRPRIENRQNESKDQ